MNDVLKAVEAQQVRFIDLWFIDILGVIKSVTLPVDHLERAVKQGVPFDGSSMEGSARVAESDKLLFPDPNTFTILPWHPAEERTARMICTVHTANGDPFIGDPRNALVRVLDEAREMGFVFKTGMELEFFLFVQDENGRARPDMPYDEASYFDMTTDRAQALRRRMITTLQAMGIGVLSTHSEIGYGQHEIDLDYSEALTSADQILTARVALKTVAQRDGVHCTFMPRPCADMPGSGMHTHQSLHDPETDANLFDDPQNTYGLSEVARYFLAGQLAHARAMLAILAPLVNSYKRLGTSFEAPINVSWAHVNRAALIRVPGGTDHHTRLELRCPDPASNPYLAAAVMLKAGLDGIRNRMPLPEPLEETLLMQQHSRLRQVEVLPYSLGEALTVLDHDDVILEALGQYISERYIQAKRAEFEAYNRYVTRWELDHYLARY